MRKLLILLVTTFLSGAAIAQGIKGKVTDSKTGVGLPGVTILIQGTNTGTATEADGNYTLNIADGTYKMNVSFIGFTTQTVDVKVAGTTEVNVALSEGTSTLDEIVVTGSRAGGRVNTESPVPVDVINLAQMSTQVPQNNLNQIMNVVAPSFTSNTSTVADGTDHIDPAQLRGLGPDQVLVLLNGKRRHTSSLVNVNGTPGRGSVGTDLNAIPAYAIEKIEVLRDGASAQYGSDAIAGVINVKMKEATGKLNMSLYSGANFSQGSNDHTGGVDGGNLQIDANYGIRLGQKGFINFTGSALTRKPTQRADFATGSIFNAYNAIEYRVQQNGGNVGNLVNDISAIKQGALGVSYLDAATQSSIAASTSISDLQKVLGADVTDNELSYRGLERRDFNMRIGQSQLKSIQLFANMAIPINENHEFYAFGGYGKRKGNAAGFYRRPNQARTYTGIFINGFLPEIHSDVIDASAAAGVRGKLGQFNYDLSNTFGSNTFNYGVENTVNTTMLSNSPTVFKAGGLNFKQNTINLDLSRKFDVLSGLNLAFGAEGRFESYRIKAGDENSYGRYDVSGKPIDINNLTGVAPTDFFGNGRPGGAQVFPGFRPINESETQDANRQSVAVYVDTELDVTDKWLLGGAVRFENYSDFGSTTNFKLATRYKLTDNINLRAAASTGFRAPSLAQIYFNSTSTQFVGGVPFEVGTFSNASDAANALGIPDLKQEESKSLSAGFTAKIPSSNLTITADAYFVRINDRVILTDQFLRPSNSTSPAPTYYFPEGTVQRELQNAFDGANATSATFFSNAINTESKGIDLVISHKARFDNGATLRTDLAGTISQTKQVGRIKASDILANNGQINSYYSEASRIYLQEAVPRVKFNWSHSLTVNKFDLFLRNAYFGKVTDPNTVDVNGDGFIGAIIVNGQAVENEHPVWAGRLITDLSVGYQITKMIKVVVGANNLFDIYPDRNYNPITAKRPSGVANGKVVYNNPAATVDLSNANQFVYSRNTSQFGMNGRFLFARLNFTF
ncbi:TonB-dependent receptor [Dyadobacter sp. CY312]|uniref:TonB-dependent receptor n=1 Tax=Dyadobacter sp. CY312 TaxID=2907303 RepID=UPI001F2AE974|nr:TonB-dependent receptor [Dyadobacter sp. CY312]MCE7041194.1 TonB-dependent receptor [Dyadobacter sp. CY312]